MSAAARRAAGQFLSGPVATLARIAGGHIHDSWRATGADGTDLLLQRLNGTVFPRLDHVMENVQHVAAHLGTRLAADDGPDHERRALTLVPGSDGAAAWVDPARDWWRAWRFITRSRTIHGAATPEQAFAAGRAFGAFQARLADFAGPRLHATLPDFHNTPARLETLARAAAADPHRRAVQVHEDVHRILEERDRCGTLERLRAEGALPERVVHNDAKLANVLFDADRETALCVIDLDTVMPGLAVHDFGDMVRSMTGTAAEDDPEPARMTVSLTHFAALADGYLGAAPFLTRTERAHLLTAALAITLEQAARFLTDFLDGDRYYRADHPDQNLDRCRTQWALYAALRHEEQSLRRFTE